jgi:hypothetical protein
MDNPNRETINISQSLIELEIKCQFDNVMEKIDKMRQKSHSIYFQKTDAEIKSKLAKRMYAGLDDFMEIDGGFIYAIVASACNRDNDIDNGKKWTKDTIRRNYNLGNIEEIKTTINNTLDELLGMPVWREKVSN